MSESTSNTERNTDVNTNINTITTTHIDSNNTHSNSQAKKKRKASSFASFAAGYSDDEDVSNDDDGENIQETKVADTNPQERTQEEVIVTGIAQKVRKLEEKITAIQQGILELLQKGDDNDDNDGNINEQGPEPANTNKLQGQEEDEVTPVDAIRSLEEQISAKERAIQDLEQNLISQQADIDASAADSTNDQINSTDPAVLCDSRDLARLMKCKDELMNLMKRKDDLMKRKLKRKDDLMKRKDDLMKRKDDLMKRKDELNGVLINLAKLRDSFLSGKYYAPTSMYWKVGSKLVYKDGKGINSFWKEFERTEEEANKIQCRGFTAGGGVYVMKGLYCSARMKAKNAEAYLVGSETSTTSASTQGQKYIRDQIWPLDIFGNKADGQHISHLIPAGQIHHKEWINVAAAAVGLSSKSSSIIERQKVVRGVIDAIPSSRRKRDSTSGILHFVSNKIRCQFQSDAFDGSSPKAMLIPIMNIAKAKEWQGEGYSAIFFMGVPNEVGGVEQDDKDSKHAKLYKLVGLSEEGLLTYKGTRDATLGEVEVARLLLEDALFALKDNLAQMTDEDVVSLFPSVNEEGKASRNGKRLLQALERAKADHLLVPVTVQGEKQKPACLVTFKDVTYLEGHPAPDPLLLAFRAANIWSWMVHMYLLANGSEPDNDDDISLGDIIAEKAYYEAKFGYLKDPICWEDLARGLGQPHGFQQ